MQCKGEQRGAQSPGGGEGGNEPPEKTARAAATHRPDTAPELQPAPLHILSWCHMVWNEHAIGQSGSAAPTTALPLPAPPPRGRAREAGKVADPHSEEN